MTIESYLIATAYCDADSPEIQELARGLTRSCRDDRHRAITVFEWVQDQIVYRIFHAWNQKASETLAIRGGACTNKANLYVALMRALGIPAGFHVLTVNGRRYFGPGWIDMVGRLCSEMSVHIHPAVHLNDRWLKCDPTDDIGLTKGTAHVNPPSERIAFDGHRDAVLNFDPAHIHDYSGCLPNIDRILAKRSEKPPIFFRIMDLYLEFARQFGSGYDLHNAEGAFRAWLTAEFPDEYAEFRLCEKALIEQVE